MRPVLLAIDGRSGAGKTTLSARLAQALRGEGRDVEVFHLENLYAGWYGLEAGLSAYLSNVLTPLAAGAEASWTPWDWGNDAPALQRERTRPAEVVLCEGVGSGIPQARALLSGTLTLTAAATWRRDRALTRDGETYRPWWNTWAAQEERLAPGADGPRDLTLTLGAGDEASGIITDPLPAALAWADAAIAATAAPR